MAACLPLRKARIRASAFAPQRSPLGSSTRRLGRDCNVLLGCPAQPTSCTIYMRGHSLAARHGHSGTSSRGCSARWHCPGRRRGDTISMPRRSFAVSTRCKAQDQRFAPSVSFCFLLFPSVSFCFLLFPSVSFCFLLFPSVSFCFLL